MKSRINKLTVWLLTLAMLITLMLSFAFTTFAADETAYPLSVGGVQFTSNNLTIEDGNGGTATYDPTTNTLTLNNYTCTDAGYEVSVISHTGSDTLYMVLIGTSAVSGNADESGVYSNGNVAISGTGSLTATGGGAYNANYGVRLVYGSITISDSASLTAIGGASVNSSSFGVFANNGINVYNNGNLTGIGGTAGGDGSEGVNVASGGNITVSGNGSVTGIGSTATVQSAGLNINGAVTISDNGSVTAKSDTANYSWGVNTPYSVSISGSGKLKAESGTATGAWDSESYGVCAVRGITVSDNGSLTATGGVADGDSATSYGVGSYGSGIITINGGTTIAQGNNGAFDVTPTIGETFDAKVWYGEDETAANTAGAKAKSELANQYNQKYVKVAEESVESDTIVKYDEDTKSAIVTVKEAGTYSLIFAKYGEGNRLDKIDIVEFSFKKGENTVPQEIKDFTLGTGDKIMLWQDMTNLVPLCEAYIVK